VLSGQEEAGLGVLVAGQEPYAPSQLSGLRLIARFVRHKPLGMFGVGVVLVLSLAAGAAPWLSRYDAEQTFRVANPAYVPGSFEPQVKLDGRAGPSLKHWFGTDQFGRDNYARVVWGARRSLGVALGALLFAIIVGTAIGIVSGYYRGWLDMLLQRLMDSIQAFPAMFILLLLVALTEPNLVTLSMGLGFVALASVQRIIRSAVLTAREEPHVEAARAIGCSPARLMAVHILPNVATPIIVVFSIGLGSIILAEASLAFLGLAPIEPPSWGMMLNEGRGYMQNQPSTMLAGGLAITLAVLGFNLAGDALRDFLDPRIRLQ
jgi:peptide/nickel transport system permease protein